MFYSTGPRPSVRVGSGKEIYNRQGQKCPTGKTALAYYSKMQNYSCKKFCEKVSLTGQFY
jgi:hypothetical protein